MQGQSPTSGPVAGVAQGMRFALAVSRWNESITSNLRAGAIKTLIEHGCKEGDIECVEVSGAFELPFVAKRLAETGRYDAIICLGCVIRGDTPHFEYICHWAAVGIGQVGLETGVPVAFGVITADTLEQAFARSGDGPSNKGAEAARAAIELCELLRRLKSEEDEQIANFLNRRKKPE